MTTDERGCDRCGCGAGMHQYGRGQCFACRDAVKKTLTKSQLAGWSPCGSFLERDPNQLPGLFMHASQGDGMKLLATGLGETLVSTAHWDAMRHQIMAQQESQAMKAILGLDTHTAYQQTGRASTKSLGPMPVHDEVPVWCTAGEETASIFAKSMAAFKAGRQMGKTQTNNVLNESRKLVEDFYAKVRNNPHISAHHTAYEAGLIRDLREDASYMRQQADQQAKRLAALQARNTSLEAHARNEHAIVETYKREAATCKAREGAVVANAQDLTARLTAAIDVRDRYWNDLLEARRAAVSSDLLVDALRAELQVDSKRMRQEAWALWAVLAAIGFFLTMAIGLGLAVYMEPKARPHQSLPLPAGW